MAYVPLIRGRRLGSPPPKNPLQAQRLWDGILENAPALFRKSPNPLKPLYPLLYIVIVSARLWTLAIAVRVQRGRLLPGGGLFTPLLMNPLVACLPLC